MALPVTIPNQFANATSSIPLSQLDSNFSTLANVVNEINAGTQQLANANVAILIVNAGTSAAPTITTTGDTNTGIFFPAADTIGFAEGGAEAMRIDSSGNVGIGTASPFVKLDVSGNSSFGLRNTTAIPVTGAEHYFGSSPSDTTRNNVVFNFSNDGVASARIRFYKSKGSSASPTGVDSGNPTGIIQFYGYDGTNYINSASIQSSIDGTPGTNDMPGNLIFSTTADGAAAVTERMRITSDGYLRMASGTGGIQFGGDTAAANALDDYEEGTFTPVYSSSGGSFTTLTYSEQTGRYTKIGNIVFFSINVFTSNVVLGSASGTLFVSGLPFTALNIGQFEQAPALGRVYRWGSAITNMRATVVANSTQIAFHNMATNAANATAAAPSDLTTGSNTYYNAIDITGCYRVA